MKASVLKPAVHTKYVVAAFGLTLIAILLFLRQAFPGTFTAGSLRLPHSNISAHDADSAAIPNIVHFVHLVDNSPHPVFDFPFRQFVAIYSAWYYLRPTNIYIHTNVEEHLIEEALKDTKNQYTKAVIKLPGVSFRHATPPDHTKSGAAISKLPNQSDFVRTVVLGELGGIYLDDDSYVLRDLKPLRNLGFDNVIGQQLNKREWMAKLLSAYPVISSCLEVLIDKLSLF